MADKKLSPDEIATNLRFVANIPRWLRTRGLKRSDIMNKLGTSEATVSKWLSGKQTMTVQQFNDVATLLGLEPHELLIPPDDVVSGKLSARYSKAAGLADALPDDVFETWIAAGEAMRRPKD